MKENLILEALNYDIDVLCPLRWALLRFLTPTNLNRKFVNNETKEPKFRDTVNSAIELMCNIAFDGAHTQGRGFCRQCQFLFATHKTKTGILKKKCRAWGVGEDSLAMFTPDVTVLDVL